MNLGKKLLLTAVIPMLMVLFSGAFAVWQTNGILKEFADVSTTYEANTRAALEMQMRFQSQIHQWKSVLLRGADTRDREKYWAEFLQLEKEIQEDGAALVPRLGNSRAAPIVREFLDMHKRLGAAYRYSLRVFLASGYDSRQADVLIRGMDRGQAANLRMAVDLIAEESDAFARRVISDAWHTAWLNFFGMLVTLLGAALIFHSSLKRIVLLPIDLFASFARKFGDGDYSQRIASKSDDELGTLSSAFNQAMEKIELLVSKLNTSKTRYHNLIQGVDAIIWEWDPQANRYTFVSQRAEDMLGYPLSNWLDQPGFLERCCHPDDYPECREKIGDTLLGAASGEYTCRAIAANGSIVWLNNRIRLIRDERSRTVSILGVMVDITRMKQYEDRMAYLSTHDELTGLANRNMLGDRLAHAIVQAEAAGGMVALLLVNIDRFKLINESLGHQMGDEVIQCIAQRLLHVIGRAEALARLGADEFAVVLPDIGRPEDAAEVAKEILRRVALPLEVDGNSLSMNCSIGISVYPKDGMDASVMLKNADSALSRVKLTERNSFKYYAEEMNALALASLRLENKVRNAIENREFVLYYQPQISISENRLIGVEALVRWVPPDEPMVPPERFIPLTEETNLILPLGEWILHEACRQNKAWQEQGFAPFCVAVNLSAIQFSRTNIVDLVARTLAETGLASEYLELEITESVVMHDLDLVIKNLQGLHELGVKLAIDDFGTGYSSLSYLKCLPIDKLKVDKSFVQDIAADRGDGAIVAAIIAMAHNLEIGVTAEGVESETQLQYLRDRQCDEVQGNFYSQPLAADVLEGYLFTAGLFASTMAAHPLSRTVPAAWMEEGSARRNAAESWHLDTLRVHDEASCAA